MAYRILAAAVGLAVAFSPASATQTMPMDEGTAPPAGPGALYCMRIAPITGSKVEQIKCWTREQWAEQGVDVDHDWAKEGIRVIG
jgi:hypothetical protein